MLFALLSWQNFAENYPVFSIIKIIEAKAPKMTPVQSTEISG